MTGRYKLIAMDLDGTLLDSKKQVSDRAKKVLHQIKEMGIPIAHLSGRMYDGIRLIEDQIGFYSIKASSAGTYITDSNDACMADLLLNNEDLLFLYEQIANKYQIPIWIYKGRDWYVSSIDWYVENESRIIQVTPKLVNVEELIKGWEKEGTGPNKVLFGADGSIIDQIKADLEASEPHGFDYARSASFYLEVFPRGASKGNALDIICKHLGISLDQVIAFGDQELDLPMLKAAGLGVAVANAPDSVKMHADVVTLSNEEDGVAIALEKYVLKKDY